MVCTSPALGSPYCNTSLIIAVHCSGVNVVVAKGYTNLHKIVSHRLTYASLWEILALAILVCHSFATNCKYSYSAWELPSGAICTPRVHCSLDGSRHGIWIFLPCASATTNWANNVTKSNPSFFAAIWCGVSPTSHRLKSILCLSNLITSVSECYKLLQMHFPTSCMIATKRVFIFSEFYNKFSSLPHPPCRMPNKLLFVFASPSMELNVVQLFWFPPFQNAIFFIAKTITFIIIWQHRLIGIFTFLLLQLQQTRWNVDAASHFFF